LSNPLRTGSPLCFDEKLKRRLFITSAPVALIGSWLAQSFNGFFGDLPDVRVTRASSGGAVRSDGLGAKEKDKSSSKNLVEIGVFLRCTGRDDVEQALAAVKAIGLSLIQVSKLSDRFYTPEGAKEFAQMMASYGIRARSVVIAFEGESYKDLDTVQRTVGFRPPNLLKTRLAYSRKCVDFAAALDISIITLHMGVLPKDPANPIYQQLLHAVGEMASYAGAKGVTLSLETGQETGEELAHFLEKITTAPVGVNFDIANLVLYGMDQPQRALTHLLDRVTSVHVKDGLRPDKIGSLGRETRLGEGAAQVSGCLHTLSKAGFNGPLIIENYVWRELKTDPLDELRKAKEFVQAAIAVNGA
jgi:L-ribulose-5-phosphate 3-epimerase